MGYIEIYRRGYMGGCIGLSRRLYKDISRDSGDLTRKENGK